MCQRATGGLFAALPARHAPSCLDAQDTRLFSSSNLAQATARNAARR
jgi:hypothetical protein